MAPKKNTNGDGWFYHTSYKRPEDADDLVADLPPASQIPGLSDLPDEFDHSIGKPVFRDTDSKYVRLAKQGGRADLLRFRENVPNTSGAKAYHRSDWFYLEDNALADAHEQPVPEQKVAFDFLLPDYMVHHEYKPRGGMDDIDNALYHQKHRAPYACDSINAFQREGNAVTDKTLRLPEVQRAGNHRSNKPKKFKQHPVPEKSKGPQPESGQVDKMRAKKFQDIPAFKDTDKAMMCKLISNSYEHEYKDMLEKWQNKNRTKGDKHAAVRKVDHSGHSEYQTVFAHSQDEKHKVNKHSAGIVTSKRRSSQDEDGLKAGYRQTDTLGQHDAKDLFKLSRFKNIPSKVDSHPHQRQNQHVNPNQHHSPPNHLVAAGAH